MTLASKKAASTEQRFGNLAPWAEPAWYNSLHSPYYNDSHRRLREYIRSYIDTNVLPYSLEWEEKGEAPREEALKWARTGVMLASAILLDFTHNA